MDEETLGAELMAAILPVEPGLAARPYAVGVPGHHPLEPLTGLDGVADAVAEARQACEELRWHRALRRQWAAARAEAGVRSAWAGATLDGVRVPLALVRDVARGAAEAPPGPDGDAVRSVLRVQAEVERRMRPPGAAGGAREPLRQLLVRWHVAAVGGDGGVGDGDDGGEVGRPRRDEPPQDLRGLGAAPSGVALDDRLAMLGELAAAPLPPEVPALVLAAVLHGELLTLRPFRRANAAVARALFRHQLTAGGVEPVGVAVPEVAWVRAPTVHLSRAAGFATGTPEGVGAWLRWCAESVTAGAAEGRAIADAVLSGRLDAGT